MSTFQWYTVSQIIPFWYGLTIATSFLLVWLIRNYPKVSQFCVGVRSFCQRHLVYEYYQILSWKITPLEGILLVFYIVGNGLCLGLNDSYSVGNEVMIRSGMMSSVNMIPLFFGGRTSILADKLGLPFNSYYFIHQWVGMMAILEGALHAILAFISRDHENHSKASGIVLFIFLMSLMVVSICLVGRVMFEASLKGHLILAIFTIGALIWHSVPGSFYEVVIPVTAFLLWSLNRAWRAWRVESSQKSHWLTKFYYNSPTGQLADRKLAALKLKVELERPMLVGPGQYVYLIFRGLRLTDKLQAHPFMICWWDDPEDILPGAKNLNSPQQTLHFLIHPRNGLTARLAQENSLESIEVDGPYGQDLHLELYDTVILVARGIGIATMLTYAKRLIKWKSSPTHKRRVLTRKLDLYWELDENCQEKWVGEYLNDLRDKNDTLSTKLIQIWCYFPNEKQREPIFRTQDDIHDYQCFYPESERYMPLKEAVEEVCSNSIGKSIVFACGIPDFTESIRQTALSKSSFKHPIKFLEAEYRPVTPVTVTSSSPESPDEQSLELQNLKPIMISRPILPSESTGRREIKLHKFKVVDKNDTRAVEASFV